MRAMIIEETDNGSRDGNRRLFDNAVCAAIMKNKNKNRKLYSDTSINALNENDEIQDVEMLAEDDVKRKTSVFNNYLEDRSCIDDDFGNLVSNLMDGKRQSIFDRMSDNNTDLSFNDQPLDDFSQRSGNRRNRDKGDGRLYRSLISNRIDKRSNYANNRWPMLRSNQRKSFGNELEKSTYFDEEDDNKWKHDRFDGEFDSVCGSRIYIRNLPKNMNKYQIARLFSKIGKVVAVRMDKSPIKTALVYFLDRQSGLESVKKFNGFAFRGCKLKISVISDSEYFSKFKHSKTKMDESSFLENEIDEEQVKENNFYHYES